MGGNKKELGWTLQQQQAMADTYREAIQQQLAGKKGGRGAMIHIDKIRGYHRTGVMMNFNFLLWICGWVSGADKSAMGTINRPLHMAADGFPGPINRRWAR